MKFFITIFCICYSQVVFSISKNVEIWFLSPNEHSSLYEKIKSNILPSALADSSIPANCIPMGEGCFHPQYGMIYTNDSNKENRIKEPPTNDTKEKKDQTQKYSTINSEYSNSNHCTKNSWDIYCGNAKPYVKPKIGIWIDTSSSMSRVDYSKDLTYCKRRTFIEKLMKGCKSESVSISSFNTIIKEVDTFDDLCLSYGLNNTKKIIKWIDNSDYDHLIVITDIDEMSIELGQYIEENGIKTIGIDAKLLFADNLESRVNKTKKICTK